jgi:hypothetical protein
MTPDYLLLHNENMAFVESKTDSLAEKNEVLLNLNRQIGLPHIPEGERYERLKIILILILFISVLLWFNILAFTILSKIFVIPIQPQYVLGYFFSICGALPIALGSTYFLVIYTRQFYYLLTDFRQKANSRYEQLLENGIRLEGEVLDIKPELHPRFTLNYRFSSPSGRKIKSRYTVFAACALKKGDKIMVLYKDNKNHLPL